MWKGKYFGSIKSSLLQSHTWNMKLGDRAQCDRRTRKRKVQRERKGCLKTRKEATLVYLRKGKNKESGQGSDHTWPLVW